MLVFLKVHLNGKLALLQEMIKKIQLTSHPQTFTDLVTIKSKIDQAHTRLVPASEVI